jgi:hypothetical protein
VSAAGVEDSLRYRRVDLSSSNELAREAGRTITCTPRYRVSGSLRVKMGKWPYRLPTKILQ